MENDIVDKWMSDHIEKEHIECKAKGEPIYDEKIVNKVISELSYYIALKEGVKLNDDHLKNAILWASTMPKIEIPEMSYSMIYHFTYDDVKFENIGVLEFGDKTQKFSDSNKFFYIMSESCANEQVANFLFCKPEVYTGGKKMLYNMFKRIWKISKLTLLTGYHMIKNVYSSESKGMSFVDISDSNNARGIARATKIIKDMYRTGEYV